MWFYCFQFTLWVDLSHLSWIVCMMFINILQLCLLLCWVCSICLFCVCLFVSCACLWFVCVVLTLLHDFTQECKRISVGEFDEPLFSHIFVPLCINLDEILVFNYLLLVNFHLFGFIEWVIEIVINLDLIGLIFIS